MYEIIKSFDYITEEEPFSIDLEKNEDGKYSVEVDGIDICQTENLEFATIIFELVCNNCPEYLERIISEIRKDW